jgi:hypothetical protein
MIPPFPKRLTLTINDQIETRTYQTKQSMRFPVDEETTAKLKRMITLDTSVEIPWWRRLLRWLERTK